MDDYYGYIFYKIWVYNFFWMLCNPIKTADYLKKYSPDKLGIAVSDYCFKCIQYKL